MKRCSILVVNPGRCEAHKAVLARLGFEVHQVSEWPEDDGVFVKHEAIVVRIDAVERAPVLAARIRVKPRFGRRVLIAIVPESAPDADRRAAQAGGFDDVLSDTCDGRLLAARIFRKMRTRPELRCELPTTPKPRTAA